MLRKMTRRLDYKIMR
ncbi:hypothetical protein RCM87_13800 [Escherichia marmotae]|uniref:Uncharacterized protein n=1 Tax=Escherichia marmotae TaxID=1499973 RepID=A0AAW5MFW4_9ESCH|nr:MULTISPECIES: hypothetical protein [Escherichia]MBY7304686.1 hypothetical protein [Escherichia marmotae]MBY7377347.1 hypothetical protein [Escherichia marmotae]MBY7385649.1 hypothetical protein [Escherichia marmotae]MBY7413545.1 hypothetical protein [Escherichia marmotae]MBY7471209.1 hypothetical protein [Escherichia marmotae]